MSEKQIRLDLAREAANAEKAAADGDNNDDVVEDDAKGIHPSLFVAQGLQLEDDQ